MFSVSAKTRVIVSGVFVGLVVAAAPVSAAPVPVEGLQLSASNLTSIQPSWDPYPGAVKYRVSISTSSDFHNVSLAYSTSHWYTATNLTRGTVYYVKVRAVVGSALSDPSATLRVRTNDFPQKLRVVDENSAYTEFKWARWIGARHYQFAISSRSDMKGARIYDGGNIRDNSTTPYSLDKGTRYYSQVRAVTSSGQPLTRWSPVLAHTAAF
jgi:hypothetical protein